MHKIPTRTQIAKRPYRWASRIIMPKKCHSSHKKFRRTKGGYELLITHLQNRSVCIHLYKVLDYMNIRHDKGVQCIHSSISTVRLAKGSPFFLKKKAQQVITSFFRWFVPPINQISSLSKKTTELSFQNVTMLQLLVPLRRIEKEHLLEENHLEKKSNFCSIQ